MQPDWPKKDRAQDILALLREELTVGRKNGSERTTGDGVF